MEIVKHWSSRIRRFAGPTPSSNRAPTHLPRGFWLSGWSRGIGSASGPRTAPNGPSRIFATAKAGLILVNVNPAYRLSELGHALRTVGCRALISATRFKTSDYIAMIRELVPELSNGSSELKSSRLPELRYVIAIEGKHGGCVAFDGILERGKQAGNARLDTIAATIQIDDGVHIQLKNRR